MSYEVLTQDLRQKSNDRIKHIRLEAEIKAKEYQALKRKELEQYQASAQDQMKELAEKVAAPILHKAEKAALAIEDEAVSRLSDRLYAMATDMLKQVRQQDYENVFAELVREIPEIGWEKIRVNPLDKEQAKAAFPGAEIEVDPSVTGGFTAIADSGRYEVINTLDRRLEKGWPFILPLLLEDIMEGKDAAAAP